MKPWENMGKVIAKIFNRPERKYKQVDGHANYKYQKLTIVTNQTRQKYGDKVKLPEYMSIKVEEEVITIYIPTTIYFDNTLAEHLVFYHVFCGQFFMQTRGRNWDMYELGLGQFTPLDQMFINSLIRITDGVIICLGCEVHLPEGKKDSTNLVQVCVGQLLPTSQVPQVAMHWFSKNCKRVLPFTCKGKNYTCAQCVHDINQHIRNLKSTSIILSQEADLLLSKSSKDDKTKMVDMRSDGQEKSSGDSFEVQRKEIPAGGPIGGAKRLHTPSDTSDSDKEDDSQSESEVSILYS